MKAAAVIAIAAATALVVMLKLRQPAQPPPSIGGSWESVDAPAP